MHALFLAAFLAPTADAGEPEYISDAIEGGWETVILLEAIETTCETFSIDEGGTRWSTYRTMASVEEVLAWPDELDAEPVVMGESVELLWSDYEAGPGWPEGMGCQTPNYTLRDGSIRAAVIRDTDSGWTISPWFDDDTGLSVDGTGELPPCGEAEQQSVIDDLNGDSSEGEERYDMERSMTIKEGGCSVAAGAGLTPLGAFLGLLGLARRRRTT